MYLHVHIILKFNHSGPVVRTCILAVQLQCHAHTIDFIQDNSLCFLIAVRLPSFPSSLSASHSSESVYVYVNQQRQDNIQSAYIHKHM